MRLRGSAKLIVKKQEPSNRTNSVDSINDVKVEEQDEDNLQFSIPMHEHEFTESCKKITTNSLGSRKESAKNSTAKYREKKKKELSLLQNRVKQLQGQINETDTEINEMKQKILTELQNLTKMNQRTSNENIEIYSELQILLGKCRPKNNEKNCKQQKHNNLHEIAVDFDKINLLLDTLKYRMGASGKERQSKLTYHYKSIINTLLPALYRYILYGCVYEVDWFSQGQPKPTEWEWTNQLLKKVTMDSSQTQKLKTYKQRLQNVYTQTIKGIHKLNNIKERLRQEGIKIQNIQQQIREQLNPLQCAYATIFGEKNKYRKQLLFDCSNFDMMGQMSIEDNLRLFQNSKGKKKAKKQIQR